jgi:hypothetical protein
MSELYNSDLEETGGKVLIGFAWLRTGISNSRVLVNAVVNLSIPLTAGNSVTSSMAVSSSRNQSHAVRCNPLPSPMMTKQAVSELKEEISFGCGLACLPNSHFQQRTPSTSNWHRNFLPKLRANVWSWMYLPHK